jgi:hypothetical protein
MLTRMLPGGVMVAAALTVPEFSVGAGDLGRGRLPDEPPEPAAKPDPAKTQRLTASTAPTDPRLAGVRYAPIIDLGTDTAHAATRTRAQAARPVAAGRKQLTEDEQLDRAAALAAAVLDDLTAPPGLAPDTALAAPTPAASPQPDALDQAAQYSASVIENAVDQAAAVSAPRGGALSASAPLAAQTLAATALTAAPASAPIEVSPAAPPVVPIAAAAPAASLPVPSAPAATAPQPVAAVVASTPPARGMIEQVKPARIAAARPAKAPASASTPAAAPARVAPVSAPKPASPAASASAPAKPAAPAAVAAVAAPRQAPALSAPGSAAGAARITDLDYKASLLTRVDGRSRGQVDFQQTPAGLKVRLGSVAEVLADRLPAAELARIRGSSSANAWLSLAELQAQGIPISYDPVYDEFNIGQEDTRPKAARKVHIDQISTPERNAGSATIDQIRRR